MSKRPKPYLRCEKRGEDLVLTLMGSGSNGHVLKGRGIAPAADKTFVDAVVIQLIDDARKQERN